MNMSAEKIWYFAQGEAEQGPLTESQIRSMASTGTLRRDDLVWREGMKQWVPAREVPDLFQAAPAAASPSDNGSTEDAPIPTTAARQPAQPATIHRHSFEVLTHARVIGQPLVLVGLLLVLGARGCETVHSRYVDRVQAIATVAESQFQNGWTQERKALQTKLTELQEKVGRSTVESQQMLQLRKDIVALKARKTQEQNEKRNGVWREQQTAARDAEAAFKMWGWLRESVFVFGTIGLAIGLLAVGFSGSGPERWISLIMIAIITFSIYVGGIAWLNRFTR